MTSNMIKIPKVKTKEDAIDALSCIREDMGRFLNPDKDTGVSDAIAHLRKVIEDLEGGR